MNSSDDAKRSRVAPPTASFLMGCLIVGMPATSQGQSKQGPVSVGMLDQATVAESSQAYKDCKKSLDSKTDSSGTHADIGCSHPDWAPVEMNLQAAWDLLRTADPSRSWQSQEPGAGMTIGQVDTGYTYHPAIKSSLALGEAVNTLKPHQSAQDTMSRGLLGALTFGLLLNPAFRDPGHGTKTASIAIGDPRQASQPSISGWVTGVVPGARLIPVRGTKGPGLLVVGPFQAAKALCYLAGGVLRPDEEQSGELCLDEPSPSWGKGLPTPRLDSPVQVITISRGAPTSENLLRNTTLRGVLDFARDRGIIVVAASGDHETFTVYPAESCAVISVGASVISGAPWTDRPPLIGSPRARRDDLGRYDACGQTSGLKIDVSAPGAGVWRAVTRGREGRYRPEAPYAYGVGKGTSFATPAVAGVAAMWLQYRGAEVRLKYQDRRAIPYVFSYILRNGGGARSGREVCEEAKRRWNLGSKPSCDVVQRAWMAEDGETSLYGSGILDALGVLTAKLPDMEDVCSDLRERGGASDSRVLECPTGRGRS